MKQIKEIVEKILEDSHSNHQYHLQYEEGCTPLSYEDIISSHITDALEAERARSAKSVEQGWVSALKEMTEALKQERALSKKMADALEFYAIRDRCFGPEISPAKQALAEYKAALKAIK